ncbi:TIR domain-containing protein [Sphaerotilus sp.]|uniref:TIR domain-containing protein n=1 Tax=Sphaerotilus sp. TaxID=2093942 RepID=UPI00286DEEB6|nr:TIR domain-containing protein [Sphaerotilus sp.]
MADNTATATSGVRVFVSYAHHDKALMESLLRNLSSLKRSGLVSIWDDREIPPGDAWADVIDERLNQADVVLLLISAAFIDSPYCYGLEMKRAAERNADEPDRAVVIPVILENCDWEALAPLKAWHVVPTRLGDKGVSSWPSPADHHTAVAKDLRKRLTGLIDADSTLWQRTTRRLRDPLWWQQPAVWGAGLVGLVGLTAAGWMWQAAREAVALEVSAAENALRSGRYDEAQASLAAQCGRWLVGEPACWAQQKVTITQALAQPDAVDIERFSQQVRQLQAQRPEDPDVLYLGGALAILGSSGTAQERAAVDAQAEKDIHRAIELAQGKFPEANFYLAGLAQGNGHFERAVELLNRAIHSNSHGPHYLNARAAALTALGRLDEAAEDYRSSAQQGLVASRVDGAVVMWRRGQWTAAVAQLDAARQALAPPKALTGRNALPWVYDLLGKDPLTLKTAADKRCLAALMLDVAQRLAAGDGAGAAPLRLAEDCGVDQRAGVPLAVAEMLAPVAEGQAVRQALMGLANANGGGA